LYNYVAGYIKYDSNAARVILSSLSNKEMRKGALAAYQSGAGVCMEYADLLVALARADHIPARWRVGLAYQGKDDRDKSALQLGHAWVDISLPKLGWVPVDPPWGTQ